MSRNRTLSSGLAQDLGDDKHDYEEFMSTLWANKSVKFQTVRAP